MADEILRTPDERFHDLPRFPWAPRYTDVDGLRVARIDEGPADAPVVLLLHGEPSWGFLYRKMVDPLLAAGFRVVAPDLVGFGRSDKLADPRAYTYQRHVDWMKGLLRALDLRDVTLFCQDWGGLIGLRLAAEEGGRFARVCAANTYLPTGDERVPRAFHVWKTFALHAPLFPVGRIVSSGCARGLLADARAAYDAPFPTARHKAGARAFPALVPVRPDDPASEANRAAWAELARWDKPFLTLFGRNDPITRGAERRLQERIPGAAAQPHAHLAGAGHFLQEDVGLELAERLAKWATPAR
ncbi:MAG: haloalkane dehalogenase [Polyangiales bacterium]